MINTIQIYRIKEYRVTDFIRVFIDVVRPFLQQYTYLDIISVLITAAIFSRSSDLLTSTEEMPLHKVTVDEPSTENVRWYKKQDEQQKFSQPHSFRYDKTGNSARLSASKSIDFFHSTKYKIHNSSLFWPITVCFFFTFSCGAIS